MGFSCGMCGTHPNLPDLQLDRQYAVGLCCVTAMRNQLAAADKHVITYKLLQLGGAAATSGLHVHEDGTSSQP